MTEPTTPPDVEARMQEIDREAAAASVPAGKPLARVYRRHVEVLLIEREVALRREAALRKGLSDLWDVCSLDGMAPDSARELGKYINDLLAPGGPRTEAEG